MPDLVTAALAGLMSLVAYGIAIWAMARASLGPVSALRESSIVFATLIGALILKERPSLQRAFSCLLIMGGVICVTLF